MLDRAEYSITKQLDLVQFIRLQRMQWLSLLTLLKPPQLRLVEDLTKMLIHESSDLDVNDEIPYQEPIMEDFKWKKLVKSEDKVDQRLLQMIGLKLRNMKNEDNDKKDMVSDVPATSNSTNAIVPIMQHL